MAVKGKNRIAIEVNKMETNNFGDTKNSWSTKILIRRNMKLIKCIDGEDFMKWTEEVRM